jgi:small subunit ribosomal protein S21
LTAVLYNDRQVIQHVSNTQTGIEVSVRDNDVEQAIKALKRKIARDGLLKQLKSKKAYEKPSERRKRKLRESKRRIRKAMARRAKRAPRH